MENSFHLNHLHQEDENLSPFLGQEMTEMENEWQQSEPELLYESPFLYDFQEEIVCPVTEEQEMEHEELEYEDEMEYEEIEEEEWEEEEFEDDLIQEEYERTNEVDYEEELQELTGEDNDGYFERHFDSQIEYGQDFTFESEVTLTSEDYIKWVQRSLNRILKLNIKTDGVITQEYRNALRAFNKQVLNGRNYNDIDEKTQNAVILLNEKDSNYIKWVQEALLLASGATIDIEINGEKDDLTRKAIKGFQKKKGLKVDGFVGAKTEWLLVKSIETQPPGSYDTDYQQNGDNEFILKLERASINLDEIIPLEKLPNPKSSRISEAQNRERVLQWKERKAALKCILNKSVAFLRDQIPFEDLYVDTSPPYGKFRFDKHFINELREKFSKNNDTNSFHKNIYQQFLKIETPIYDTFISYHKIAIDAPSSAPLNSPECLWLRFFRKKSEQQSSIYSCFRRQMKPFDDFCKFESETEFPEQNSTSNVCMPLPQNTKLAFLPKNGWLQENRTSETPFRYICQIELSYEDTQNARAPIFGYGTGVLVGNKHILTAAHVIKPFNGYKLKSAIVSPGMNGEAYPFGRTQVGKVIVAKNYTPRPHPTVSDSNALDIDFVNDYAILVTKDEIGNLDSVGHWGQDNSKLDSLGTSIGALKSFRAGNYKVNIGGYPGIKNNVQLWRSFDETVPSNNLPEELLFVRNKLCQGQSGSPIWVNRSSDNGGRNLVAIFVGWKLIPNQQAQPCGRLIDDTILRFIEKIKARYSDS